MEIKELLRKDSVILELNSKTKEDVLREMCAKLHQNGVIKDLDGFLRDVIKREEISNTSLGNLVATPHAKSEYVTKPSILVGISKEGIKFSEDDDDLVKIFFLIAVPNTEASLHVDILKMIANAIDEDYKIENILNCNNYEELINTLSYNEEKEKIKEETSDYVVAVTACPTGIAHTFMARDALVKAAKDLNVKIKVETNGTDGRQNEITKDDLNKAKGVILAINKSVDEERFNGYQVIKVGAKDGISKAKELIQAILDNKGEKANYTTNNTKVKETESGEAKNVYKHLMNGVSYMLPLVISGGILIALAFLVDTLLGNGNSGKEFGQVSIIAKTLKDIGGAAFGLFIPILGGYIAFSLSGKQGLTAGLVAGAMATSGGSGFLGSLVGGLFAGLLVKYLGKYTEKLKTEIRGIYLILVIPVLSVLITGLAMVLVLNPLVGIINSSLLNFLETMNSGSRIILGLLLGAMMAVDMGGPVNKAAYLFGTGTLATSITTGGSTAMAAVMAGGMVPPLALAIATTIFKNKYSKEERQAGISNYIMGLSFITEGAIPFAAANPTRVIPPCIIGSAIAGAMTMYFDVKIPAPHGGILVMILSNHVLLYILSILIGSIISALLLAILKKK